MASSKFITETGPEAAWVLICGLTCIGKSHFMKTHGLRYARSGSGIPVVSKIWPKLKFEYPSFGTSRGWDWTLTSNPEHWSCEQYSEDYIIKKRAIIVGAPYFTWQERIQKRKIRARERGDRKVDLVGGYFFLKENTSIDSFKKYYSKCIKKLNKQNIPYILVDNRNDYPILDESSFFTMLTQGCE